MSSKVEEFYLRDCIEYFLNNGVLYSNELVKKMFDQFKPGFMSQSETIRRAFLKSMKLDMLHKFLVEFDFKRKINKNDLLYLTNYLYHQLTNNSSKLGFHCPLRDDFSSLYYDLIDHFLFKSYHGTNKLIIDSLNSNDVLEIYKRLNISKNLSQIETQRSNLFKLTIVEILTKRCDVLSNELKFPANLANDKQNASLTWFYDTTNDDKKGKNIDILKGVNFHRLVNILSIDNFASFHVKKNKNVYTSLDGPNVYIPCLTVNPDIKIHKNIENLLTANDEKDEKSSQLNVTTGVNNSNNNNNNNQENSKDDPRKSVFYEYGMVVELNI